MIHIKKCEYSQPAVNKCEPFQTQGTVNEVNKIVLSYFSGGGDFII